LEKVVVIAKIKIKEEFSNEVRRELIALHKKTHENDKGCIQYDMHKDHEESNTYVFIETWENEHLLNEHMKKEHFLSFVQNVEGKLDGLEINKLEKLEL